RRVVLPDVDLLVFFGGANRGSREGGQEQTEDPEPSPPPNRVRTELPYHPRPSHHGYRRDMVSATGRDNLRQTHERGRFPARRGQGAAESAMMCANWLRHESCPCRKPRYVGEG